MTDPLTAAREALERRAWTADEVYFRAHLANALARVDELEATLTAEREVADAACRERDEARQQARDEVGARRVLAAEVERLRLAGKTVTRGTECHITRGRDG